jgi:hypothetical protein
MHKEVPYFTAIHDMYDLLRGYRFKRVPCLYQNIWFGREPLGIVARQWVRKHDIAQLYARIPQGMYLPCVLLCVEQTRAPAIKATPNRPTYC